MQLELESYIWSHMFGTGKWLDPHDDKLMFDDLTAYDPGMFIEGFCPVCHTELMQPSECTECKSIATMPLQFKEDIAGAPSCAAHGHWRIKPKSMVLHGMK